MVALSATGGGLIVTFNAGGVSKFCKIAFSEGRSLISFSSVTEVLMFLLFFMHLL